MNVKGFFALLASTIWRPIFSQLSATFRYRVAGGSDNSSLPERNGRAVIDTIYGSTVKWNQVINPLTQTIATSGLAGEITLTINNDGSITANGTTTANRYFRLVFGQKNKAVCIGMGTTDSRINYTDGYVRVNAGKKSVLYSDFKANDVYIYFAANKTYTNLTLYPQCNVLTDIFGTNAEIATNLGITEAQIDTDTGAAAFEAWLALNVGQQDYYPYDEGSLISFGGTAIKSVGFNQWDEEWELGGLMWTTGQPYNANDRIRSKNFCRCIPNKNYYTANASIGIVFFDINKDWVGYITASTIVSLGGIFTAPANAYYFKIVNTQETTYMHDICINLSDLAKNGTYEPYWEDEADLSHAYINVWDEQWEIGGLDNSGAPDTYTNRFRSKNFIPIDPTATYCVHYGEWTDLGSKLYIYLYNSTEQLVTSAIIQTSANTIIDMTQYNGVAFMKFRTGGAAPEATYNHDICINVSNADINGTYFPHALQSAGSVTDEDTETELKVITKKIDLGSLVYRDRTSESMPGLFSVDSFLSDYKKSTGSVTYICDAYNSQAQVSGGTEAYSMPNKSIALFGGYYNMLYIKDDTLTIDANGHAAALEGKFLIYELATPVVVPHDTPMQYAVDKYSTEEVIVPASADGAPTSTNIVADIEYQAK